MSNTTSLILVTFSALNKEGKLYNATCSLGETSYGNPKLNFVPKELLPFLPVPHNLGALDSMKDATQRANQIATMGINQSDVVRTTTIEQAPIKTEDSTARTQVLKALSDHGVKFSKNGKAISSSLSKVCRTLGIEGPYNAANRGRMINAIVEHGSAPTPTPAPTPAPTNDPMAELRQMMIDQNKTVLKLASSVSKLQADIDAGGDY